jgi:epoxyqueuosine reductase
MDVNERILEEAVAIGFDLAGIGPARPASGDEFRRWLDAGRAADMAWMGKDVDRRIQPAAKTAIVCGLNYFVQNPPSKIWDDPSRGRISRYAWGRDYHDVIRPMLDDLAEFVRVETGWVSGIRTNVDTGPVLERDLAVHAGLGFVGKNTNLIHPGFGSYVFLGEVLLDADLGPWAVDFKHPSCGECARCLHACPTGALVEPYVLDARKCISYLTIENKGAIPEEVRPKMGNWIFGCDECQQACPWNVAAARKAANAERRTLNAQLRTSAFDVGRSMLDVQSPGVSLHGAATRFLHFDEHLCAPKLADLMALDDAGFRERFAGTPVLRAKRSGLLRNVAVALGNGCDSSSIPVLEKAARDPDPLIREHASWALARVRTQTPNAER